VRHLYLVLAVQSQKASVRELLTTDGAGIGLFAAVSALMHTQVRGRGEGITTLAANERLLA